MLLLLLPPLTLSALRRPAAAAIPVVSSPACTAASASAVAAATSAPVCTTASATLTTAVTATPVTTALVTYIWPAAGAAPAGAGAGAASSSIYSHRTSPPAVRSFQRLDVAVELRRTVELANQPQRLVRVPSPQFRFRYCLTCCCIWCLETLALILTDSQTQGDGS